MRFIFYLNYFFDTMMGFMENRIFSHFLSLTKEDLANESYGFQYMNFLQKKLGRDFASYKWDLGKNMLIFACKKQKTHLVKFLLESGNFDLSEKDYLGFTVIHWACYMGSVDILKLFNNHEKIHAIGDNDGSLGIHWAVVKGGSKIIQYYLDDMPHFLFKKNYFNETPIHSGCKYLRYDIVKNIFGQLFKKYKTTEIKEQLGGKPLIYGEKIGARSLINYAANRADLSFLSDLVFTLKLNLRDFHNISDENSTIPTYPLELIRKNFQKVKKMTGNFKNFNSQFEKIPKSDLRELIYHKKLFVNLIEQDKSFSTNDLTGEIKTFFNVIEGIYKVRFFSDISDQIAKTMFTKLCNQLFKNQELKSFRSTYYNISSGQNTTSMTKKLNRPHNAIMSFVEHVDSRDLVDSCGQKGRLQRSHSLKSVKFSQRHKIAELRRFSCQGSSEQPVVGGHSRS